MEYKLRIIDWYEIKRNQFYVLLYCLSIVNAEPIKIHLITTNDLHGNIAPQKAWFMNPSFPPDIIGGAALVKYVNET